MKIDELISELEDVKEEHGNLETYRKVMIDDYTDQMRPPFTEKEQDSKIFAIVNDGNPHAVVIEED